MPERAHARTHAFRAARVSCYAGRRRRGERGGARSEGGEREPRARAPARPHAHAFCAARGD
eukprot:12007939-Alexandrium_andersonii.AAC.1